MGDEALRGEQKNLRQCMMDDVLALMRHPLGPEWGRNKPVYKGLYCDVAVLIPAGGSELAQSCIWIKQGLDVES